MDTPKSLNDALGCDLIEVFTDEAGGRYVWFLGFGYVDERSDGGFSWLHYVRNIAPLAMLLEDMTFGGSESNASVNGNMPTMREELDIYTASYFYSDAETELFVPFFEFRQDIEDGYYIIRNLGAEVNR